MLPAAAAFAIILMMATLPMARAYTQTAYVPVFYRDSGGVCGDLGANIQARFEPDHLGANTSFYETIKEYGHGIARNTGFGDFKFDEQTDGSQYVDSSGTTQYPSTEVYGDFHGYKITSVNITISEPVNGSSNPPWVSMSSQAVSLSANFSTAVDEFESQVSESSTWIWGNYTAMSSSGTVLHEWSIAVKTLGVSQPYHHYAVTGEIDGEENVTGSSEPGYAVLNSGTDFRIETVIHPSSISDFTSEKDVTYNGFTKYSTPCITTFTDEEGDWTSALTDPYSYGSSGTVPSSNEAYQWVYVS